MVPVTNDWTITDNYWDQQTSLNNEQAWKNADGTYTSRDLTDGFRMRRTGCRRAA